MSILRPQLHAATAVRIPPFLASLLFVAAGAAVGCASAKVQEIARPDGGEPDAQTVDKKDGPGSDASTNKDLGPDSAPAVCDPFSNQGCPSDQKCTALQSGSTLALGCGSKGSQSEGQDCEPEVKDGAQTGDNCGDGLACFRLGTAGFVCHQMCAPSTGPACPSSQACTLNVTGLLFCGPVTSCDPLKQDCPDNQACYAFATGAYCLGKGNKAPGSACTSSNDCAKGSTCLTLDKGNLCASFCSTTGGDPKCSGAATGGTVCDKVPGRALPEPNGVCRQPSS